MRYQLGMVPFASEIDDPFASREGQSKDKARSTQLT
jgi:hypothetical protein